MKLVRSLFLFLVLTFPAQAADSTVASMTAGAAISSTDLFYCSQASGTNDRKCTGAQILTWVQAGWGTGNSTAIANAPNTAGGFLAPAGALTLNALVIGGGSGTGPSTTTTGTGVLTALGQAVNGSGAITLTTSPAFVTPNLGTPSAATLTNATGLPISTGVSGLGTGVATALGIATESSGAFTRQNGLMTTGNCLKWSVSGIQDAGAACSTLTFPATVAGTTNSGGIPYFSGATTLSSSAALAANAIVIGGGAGAAPATTTTGTGVLTALGNNVGSAGAVLTTNTSNTISVGWKFTAYSIGTVSSGTTTPDAANGNYQYYTNNGAHTLAAPAADCAMDILITNGASAGAITFSGFTVGSYTGDALTTVNTNKFLVNIVRINSVATYMIKALQ